MLQIEKIFIPKVSENTYIIYNEHNEALIIDPGDEPQRIIQHIKDNGWKPQAVLITHAHPDHVGAVDEVRDEFGIEAYVHEIEAEMFEDPMSIFVNRTGDTNRPAENLWTEADMGEKQLGSFTFEIAFVPGHSPGHVVYIFHDDRFVMCGDTVFRGAIGRTDLKGGSLEALMNGIKNEIISLPSDYELYPGHGDKTTVEREVIYNQFLQQFRNK